MAKRRGERKMFPLGVVERADRDRPGFAFLVRDEATRILRLADVIRRGALDDYDRMRELHADLRRGALGWKAMSAGERRAAFNEAVDEMVEDEVQKRIKENPDGLPIATSTAIAGGRAPALEGVLDFVRAGENTLRLYPDLAAALVRTKVRAPREVFRMPYPVVEILPPREILRNWWVNVQGSVLPVTACAVWLSLRQGRLRMTLYGGSPDGHDLLGASVLDISLTQLLGGGGMFDEKVIREAVVSTSQAGGFRRGDSRWEALRLAINAVLYMNSSEADVQPTPQTRAEDEREERERGRRPESAGADGGDEAVRSPERPPCRPRSHNVGRKVRIPGIRIGGGGDGSGPKIRHQFWVRGHWHLYRVGEGRAHEELKWVQPYRKGKGRGLPMLYKRDYEAEVG